MLRMRILSLFLALMCMLGLAMPAGAAEVESGSVYCFSPLDFSGEDVISGICITGLPENVGSVMLGSRILQEGDILTAQQVSQMTFSPIPSQVDLTAQVEYLPIYENTVAPCASMTIGIRGKEMLPPAAEDQAMETYKNLPGTGKLKVSDPEGETLTYTLVRSPKRGSVEIREDGTFTYTPKKNKVGVDSFTYTAADPSGKVSREATVTITILKPSQDQQYTDTLGKECRFAAEWMKNTGIFLGEQVAENPCFSPAEAVTRGQFVTMLVKALDIPTDAEMVYTGYEDEIPQWLQPYLAAAIRSGLTAGLENQQVFGAGMPITGGEAAVMLGNALDVTVPASNEELPLPSLAVSALAKEGMELSEEQVLTRGDAAQVLYQASKLHLEGSQLG